MPCLLQLSHPGADVILHPKWASHIDLHLSSFGSRAQAYRASCHKPRLGLVENPHKFPAFGASYRKESTRASETQAIVLLFVVTIDSMPTDRVQTCRGL
jgi:hypothetical protein